MTVRSHIDEMQSHNIIRESASPYAAPVEMTAKKKSGNSKGSQVHLRYPDFTRDFIVHTDASSYGIGAVQAQMQRPSQSEDSSGETDEVEVVIAYTS